MRLLATLLLGLTLMVANSSSAAPIAISRPAASNGGPTEVCIQVVLVNVDEINSVAQSFVANCYVEAL
jgi:hypothetical protein